jgi:hypothetical protein
MRGHRRRRRACLPSTVTQPAPLSSSRPRKGAGLGRRRASLYDDLRRWSPGETTGEDAGLPSSRHLRALERPAANGTEVVSGAKGEEGVAAGPRVGTDVGLWGGEGEAPGREGRVGAGKHMALLSFSRRSLYLSLVHIFAKLITKIMVVHLASRLNKLVSPNQNAFIKGRFIQDNFMLVQQTARFLHQQRQPQLMLKLDITKVFDSVSWPS